MRHVKRAARADLHRYKAFIEMNELETGAWRGVIEDGELVEEHDEAYDEQREYADLEEIKEEASQQDDDDDEQEEPEAKEPEAKEEAGGEPKKRSARTSARRRTPTRSTPSRANGRSGSASRRKPAGARSSD